MRVLSVVTLISPDGAYGGPTRVALNQAVALRSLGHEVVVAGAAKGFARTPTDHQGVPLRLFPARHAVPGTGFAGLAAPGLGRYLRRALAAADVLHVHLARDLVTLPAAALARRRKVRYVLQTHGMIDASAHPLAGPLDAVLTRPALAGAHAVLHLTARERRDLSAVARRGLPFVELPNGVPLPPATGAAHDPAAPEVLFLARLHRRKRPLAFARAALELAEAFPAARFALVGPDEGEGPAVAEVAGAHPRIGWEGPLAPEETSARMARAAVYVLPSVDEPFPMSVLEAMALGLPVVVTASCGLAGFVAEHDAGIVVPDDDHRRLVAAVGGLLAAPQGAGRMGAAGREAVRDRLSMAAVAERLAAAYGAR